MTLYGFGCSYTKYHWKTWFDYLSEMTGIRSVNLAATGNSNEIIHESIFLQEETCDPEGIFLIMWTHPCRTSIYVDSTNIQSLSDIFDTEFVVDLYCHRLNQLPYCPTTVLSKPEDNKLMFDGKDGSMRRLSVMMASALKMLENRRFLMMHALDSDHYEKKLSNVKSGFDIPDFETINQVIDFHPLPIEHLKLAKRIADRLNLTVNDDRVKDLESEAAAQSKKIEVLIKNLEEKEISNIHLARSRYKKMLPAITKKPVFRTLDIVTDIHNAIT